MAKISVLTITNRNLYLREQAESLTTQSFQDFEWIVVDSQIDKNRSWLASQCSFPLTHIGDRIKCDYPAGGQAYNQGIIHSKGELVFFMADYVLPHPFCLERHWEIYSKYRNVFISGRSARVNCTPSQFDSVGGLVPAKDYRLGSLMNKVQIEDNLWLVQHSVSPVWWSGRNDSAPLEVLLTCNGFEEELDGKWGGHDGELANRMATYGLFYVYDTKSICIEFEHNSGGGKSIRTEDEQLKLATTLVRTKLEQKSFISNNKYSLREVRDRWLKQ